MPASSRRWWHSRPATARRLTPGLGVGVGSLEEEFDLLGAPFAGRGALADDALAALRASLSERAPEYPRATASPGAS